MLFLDESLHKGSADPTKDVKDEDMLREQEKLTKEIEQERLKIKAMRE